MNQHKPVDPKLYESKAYQLIETVNIDGEIDVPIIGACTDLKTHELLSVMVRNDFDQTVAINSGRIKGHNWFEVCYN